MNRHRSAALFSIAFSASLAIPPVSASSSSGAGVLDLLEVWTNPGDLLPHRIAVPDMAGDPTGTIVEVRDLSDLINNVTPQNGVLPTPNWPPSAVLPNGLPGNHFVAVTFSGPLDVDSILESTVAAGMNSQLTGAITVTTVNPVTGQVTALPGRAFVGGKTYAGTAVGSPPTLPLQTWFSEVGGVQVANPAIDNDGNMVPDGFGFPSTGSAMAFTGSETFDDPNVFVFVMDFDGDLASFEAFPTGAVIVVEVTRAVLGESGAPLSVAARVTSSVGPDQIPPEVRPILAPVIAPSIRPGNGAMNVDPATRVTIQFTESVQPGGFGPLTGTNGVSTGNAVQISYGAPGPATPVSYSSLPISAYDLSTIVLTTSCPFPGSSESSPDPTRVDVRVSQFDTEDLSSNLNTVQVDTFFLLGEGPGITNAPVAPDAIYVGLSGAGPGLSVIDLNGFGAGTGDPTYDAMNPVTEGNTNYPNNPNLKLQGSLLRPPLEPGLCTVNGGSAGVFTRALDANLDPRLARSPVLVNVGDMVLGASLDLTFNNGPAPFGCQSGGGNLCASTALKTVVIGQGGASTTSPDGMPVLNTGFGAPNPISWAPHPNPPPLVYPPLCVSPNIGGQEPTSIETITVAGLTNFLAPGDPFGNPSVQVPPSGLLTPEQNAWFQGPSLPQFQPNLCEPFMMRQQVGHFLYVVDRVRQELVVLNSNRMTVIDRIPMIDPVKLAISPNLDLLAVTSQAANRVTFIDVEPSSASFHQVVKVTNVGASPRGIAWDSLNEDVLVCNEASDSVSIISAFSLNVRKVVFSSLSDPFDVVITPRQGGFGSFRNVYYGYVLGRDGRVSIFESGPNGVGGWGYDDIIGEAEYVFQNPKAIQVDLSDLSSAVWIAHEGAIDVVTGQAGPPGMGALSRLHAEAGMLGVIRLRGNSQPQFRDLEMRVDSSLDETVLSGIPVDLAFDNLRNYGALPNLANAFSAGAPALFNGKSLVRGNNGLMVPANAPAYLFVAVPNSMAGGVVDVIELAGLGRFDTNHYQPGIQSVPMPGVAVLMDYFRQ